MNNTKIQNLSVSEIRSTNGGWDAWDKFWADFAEGFADGAEDAR